MRTCRFVRSNWDQQDRATAEDTLDLHSPAYSRAISALDEQRLRILDHLLDLHQVLHRRRTVDDAMVV